MRSSMGDYDDLFNEYFNDEDFGGDEEKRELCKESFNELLKNVDNLNFLNKSDIKNLVNEDLNNSDEEWDRKDFPIISNEVKGVSEIDEMIVKYDMTIYDLYIERNNLNYFVTEVWESEEGDYRMEQKYILSEDLIMNKKSHIVVMIVDELLELGIDKNNMNYISYLDDFSKNEIYKDLLRESIEVEDYRMSAIYRDLIKN